MFFKQLFHKIALLSMATLLLSNLSVMQAAVATCSTQEDATKIKGMAGTFPVVIQKLIDMLKENSSCNASDEEFDEENTLLLYGPRGNGKTFLAKKIAQTTQAQLQKLSGLKLLKAMIKENPQSNEPSAASQVDAAFAKAIEYTQKTGEPVVILIDEIDHIVKNEILLTLIRYNIDEIKNNPKILVIVTTNKEPKEFDVLFQEKFSAHCQIKMENPSEQLRLEVLNFYWKDLVRNAPINELVLKKIANKSKGLPIRALENLFKISATEINHSQSSISHESILLKNLAEAKKSEANKKAYEKALDDEAKEWSPEVKQAIAIGAIATGAGLAQTEPGKKAILKAGEYTVKYSVKAAKYVYELSKNYSL